MRYEVLGPLRVVDDAGYTEISARKIETVLAVLLTRAEQVVPLDALIAEIWGEQPPRRATAGLHVYISQLRKFLSRPDRAEPPVITRSPGYLLRLGDDEIDADVFLRQVGEGRRLLRDQRPAQACAELEAALGLWRGPVMGELRNGPIVDGFITWLTEARLECLELLAEARLLLGQHREMIGGMYVLVTENPLREAFYRQLMLALYRSERQGDALRVYQSARSTLQDELGVEPCLRLRTLHRDILAADDRLLAG